MHDEPAAPDDGAHDDPIRRLEAVRVRIVDGELRRPPLPEPLPTTGVRAGGELVPDLSALEPEHWHGALASVSRAAQYEAIETVESELRSLAQTIVRYLPATPRRTVGTDALDEPAHRPRPAVPTARHGRRQVNFRLSLDEHDRLLEAADRLGMSPTGLARAFCVSGTNRALDPRGS